MEQLEIFRIFQLESGILRQIAFVAGKQSTQFYLSSCNLHNTDPNVSYFAQKIQIER